MKDHEICEFVTRLTTVAMRHAGCDSLRAAIGNEVNRTLKVPVVKPVEIAQDSPKDFITTAKPYQTDSKGRCIVCKGWGCHECCGSEAEIRARQGTFG